MNLKNLSIKEFEDKVLENRKNLFALKIKQSLNQNLKSHKFKYLKYEYNSSFRVKYPHFFKKLLSN